MKYKDLNNAINKKINIKNIVTRDDMIDYCNTDKCLRKYILEYFGENPEFENCNNCSNCFVLDTE